MKPCPECGRELVRLHREASLPIICHDCSGLAVELEEDVKTDVWSPQLEARVERMKARLLLIRRKYGVVTTVRVGGGDHVPKTVSVSGGKRRAGKVVSDE